MKTSIKHIAAALIMGAAGVAASVLLPHAAAQAAGMKNVIPKSEEAFMQAKIKKIDVATRVVTLEGPDGKTDDFTAGPLVRLNLLKVGDVVNAEYYRSVAFIVQGPSGGGGTPVSNNQVAGALAQPVNAPGGVAVSVMQISGTVVGIDLASHTLNVINPSGGRVFTLDVTDPHRQAMLGTLKVGDTITAVISQQLAISITPAEKSVW